MPGPPPGTETKVKGGKWFIVVGRTEASEEHEKVGDPVFSPDGKRLAASSQLGFHGGTVRVWNVESGEELWSCRGHSR